MENLIIELSNNNISEAFALGVFSAYFIFAPIIAFIVYIVININDLILNWSDFKVFRNKNREELEKKARIRELEYLLDCEIEEE